MAKIDVTYHELLNKIIKNGFKYEDPNRKGIYRYQIPSYTIEHDLQHSFPAITTKKLYWKGVVGELLFFIRGDTNIKYLVDNNINIWNKDAYNYYCKRYNTTPDNAKKDGFFTLDEFISTIKSKNKNHPILGDLGRVYGAQWRKWDELVKWDGDSFDDINEISKISTDQISNLIKGLKETPMGTRHMVTAWNPAELDDMALPPCHWSFEILVEPSEDLKKGQSFSGGILDFSKDPAFTKTWEAPKYQFTLKWHQRSVDTFLGLPFNIASYALLAHIIGKMTNMIPKSLIGDLSNVHIYEPHLDAVKTQLKRSTNYHNSECQLKMDTLTEVQLEEGLKHIDNNTICIGNFNLTPHTEQPAIKAEMLPYNK